MKELARLYIKKRIQQTRTEGSDELADRWSHGKSQAKHARSAAADGHPETTASFLNRDTTLSVSEKGDVLAEAYARYAESREQAKRTYYFIPSFQEYCQKEAQQSNRIAQGLTRAAKRA